MDGAARKLFPTPSTAELLYPEANNILLMSTTVRIVTTPDVLHGKPRIEGTRIGVFTIGELVRREGWTIDKIRREFELDRAEAEAAVEYYDEHPELIETLRAQHEAGRRSIRDAGESESWTE
jgi:uncharacterized protein (DUF433 family)